MSALTNFLGDGAWLVDRPYVGTTAPAFATSAIMDASAEKISFLGCIWHPTTKTGTINIRKVHFRCGALTFNILSTIRVSLQNVSLTAGSPYQPDGTQDQTYDFALGVGLTANAWNSTGNLSADRAVDLSGMSVGSTNSRFVAVVFEYATFTAADSFIASTMSMGNPMDVLMGGHTLINTASWALLNASVPVVAFECDDGSFAFMEGAYPIATLSSASVSSTGAIRAAGLKFKFPIELTTDAFSFGVAIPNGCDGDLVLYDTDGTTALVTINVDNDAVSAQSSMRLAVARYLPKTHTANSYYRLVFVGGTVTVATVNYLEVNAAGLMDGLVGGQNWHWTQRDSGGTWADTTTRRPFAGLKLSAVHDGAGGGGSGVQYRSNMTGNI